jgi:hypothetical protein
MKIKTVLLVSLALAGTGCHSSGLDRLLGTGHGSSNDVGVKTIVIQGVLPASGAVRFTPALGTGDALVRVLVRSNRDLDTYASYEDLPRLDVNDGRSTPFYMFDSSSSRIVVYNHTTTGSKYPDAYIEIYSMHPAGYITIVQD